MDRGRRRGRGRATQLLGDRDPAASAELAGIGLLITGYSLALVDRVPIAPERLDALTAGDGWAAHALAAMRAAYAVHTGQTALGRELVDRALEGGTLRAPSGTGASGPPPTCWWPWPSWTTTERGWPSPSRSRPRPSGRAR